MANRFWNFVTALVPGNLAKAEDVNTNLSGVETGFSDVGTELDQCLQVTNSPGTMTISLNAAARAGMVVAFDASGGIIATTEIGEWKGDHADAAGTDYAERDFVADAAGALKLDSIYRCNAPHTSTGDLAADTANWDLLIDMTKAVTAQVAAEAAQTAAETAQTAAELAETNAAASYDSFDDRYLGPKSSAPTLDNDGNALITGALYFNSTSDLMFVRTSGAAWDQVPGVTLDGAETLTNKTLTSPVINGTEGRGINVLTTPEVIGSATTTGSWVTIDSSTLASTSAKFAIIRAYVLSTTASTTSARVTLYARETGSGLGLIPSTAVGQDGVKTSSTALLQPIVVTEFTISLDSSQDFDYYIQTSGLSALTTVAISLVGYYT